MKKRLIIIVAIVVFILAVLVLASGKVNAPHNSKKTDQPQQTQTTPPPSTFDKTQFSIEPSASIWAVVNKKRVLSSLYEPQDLAVIGGQRVSSEAAGPLQELLKAAQMAGVPMKVISGYRSYNTQASTYNAYVAKDGVAQADTYSARPGHSEHQTGLAADLGNGICDLEACFGQTDAGKWLAAHAYEYGFVIRYEDGKAPITGYQYEPWHIRYVGTELAAEINKSKQTLEEFFGLPAAPNY